MQLTIHKISTILFFIVFFLLLNCNDLKDSKNQISFKIIFIDVNTKKPRINMFDSVEVRKEGKGYLVKTFNLEETIVTDTSGSVIISIDSTKIYSISIVNKNLFGGEMFFPGTLKNNAIVRINVRSY